MWLASVLEWAAAVCMALSVPLMLWQLGVGIMGLFSVRKLRKLEDKTYRFAVVSCARNEEAVIGQLLDSLQNQRYPRECFDLFVIADNCTDDTAAVARKHGAIVLERQDKGHIGKGYALRWAFERIIGRWGDRYDAVVLFDADNLADPDFLLQTNEAPLLRRGRDPGLPGGEESRRFLGKRLLYPLLARAYAVLLLRPPQLGAFRPGGRHRLRL